MSLFDLFDATYGDEMYQSTPDMTGGADIMHDGNVVDHMNPDGTFESQGMAVDVPNAQGGVDVISDDGQVVAHTQPNALGGTDVYDGDMGLEHTTMPNANGGEDIYDGDMQMDGSTMPNALGGEDYFSMSGNADEILSYEDPLMHSSEYQMGPFDMTKDSF